MRYSTILLTISTILFVLGLTGCSDTLPTQQHKIDVEVLFVSQEDIQRVCPVRATACVSFHRDVIFMTADDKNLINKVMYLKGITNVYIPPFGSERTQRAYWIACGEKIQKDLTGTVTLAYNDAIELCHEVAHHVGRNHR